MPTAVTEGIIIGAIADTADIIVIADMGAA